MTTQKKMLSVMFFSDGFEKVKNENETMKN